MKKSVVIIIAVIYGLSIIFVTLFGLKHKSFNEVIYTNKIEIIEENADTLSSGLKYISLQPDDDGNCQYQLKWVVTPDNATNKAVTFNYDKSNPNISVDENGLVTFTNIKKHGSITVTITSTDGTGVSDTIQIICYNNK